jgi:hypothetical protein
MEINYFKVVSNTEGAKAHAIRRPSHVSLEVLKRTHPYETITQITEEEAFEICPWFKDHPVQDCYDKKED